MLMRLQMQVENQTVVQSPLRVAVVSVARNVPRRCNLGRFSRELAFVVKRPSHVESAYNLCLETKSNLAPSSATAYARFVEV